MSDPQFCDNFRDLVCQQNPSPRADPTGVIHTSYPQRRAEYLQALEINANERVTELMRNRSTTAAARRIFEGRLSNENLKHCLVRTVILASETTARLFSDEFGNRDRRQMREYMGNIETNPLFCQTKDETELHKFLERTEISRLALTLNKDIHTSLSDRRTGDWNRVQELFNKAQEITMNLLERRRAAETDQIRREALKEIIERVKSLSLGACGSDPGPRGNDNFSRQAYYNVVDRKVQICPQFFLNCASELCIMNALAHEIGHSFDPCQLSQLSADAFSYPNPFGGTPTTPSDLNCIFGRNNRHGIVADSTQSFCRNAQALEAFSDAHASEVMAEFIRERAFSQPHEIRASIVNSAALSCTTTSPNYVTDISRHPGRDQRIAFYEKSRSLMQLSGCREDSPAMKNSQPSCIYPPRGAQ